MKENYESVIGHHYSVEIVTPESKLQDQLDKVADKWGIDRGRKQYVVITEGDVNWDSTKKMKIPLDTFEEIVNDFENR